MNAASPITRPLMRYHGGKWKLAPWIIANMPEHRVYVEPFGGGGSVLLRKPRSYAEVYNDLDGELVNLFRVVRDDGQALVQAIELTPFSRDEFAGSYSAAGNRVEQARRTLVRSFMGFGSSSHCKATGFRANSNRSGTTPATDWRNYPSALVQIVDRLRGVVIENRDAIEVMQQHDSPETLHYVDPPYVPETRDAGTDYRHEMDSAGHEALCAALRDMQGLVMVSGYESALYERALSGWQKISKPAYADGARPRVECLWVNYDVRQQDFFGGAA